MRTLFLATAVCVAVDVSWGNGGGYDHRGVSQSGTIIGFEPADTAKVRILDEQLNVGLTPDEAHVQIRYVLKNTSKQRANVRFGFPVEELVEVGPEGDLEAAPDPKGKPRPEPQYCRDYHIELAGKPLASTFEAESKADKDPRLKGVKGWLISKMSLEPTEEKTMTIRYRADYPYTDYSVSDDGFVGEKDFKYRLSTGACWEGPIEHGAITIHSEGLKPGDLKVMKPVNRFKKDGDQLEWTFENLEPTLADDIVIRAAPAESSYGGRSASGSFPSGDETKRVEFLEREGKWSVLHSNFTAKASSTLAPSNGKTYDAKNVTGWDGPWSEGVPGNGIGEWIELTPEVAKPLLAIRVNPGHDGSEELFKANARPKRLEVLLNDEHRFEAPIEDRNGTQSISVTGYDKPVKKIRLTIKEAYPGSRFSDCCISAIRLETALSKKPNVKPAR